MNNQPILFDRIIKGNLRPWLDCNKHDEKFLQIIRVLKPCEHGAQSLYEIDLYTKYKFVEDLKQQQWKVACHCFVQGNGTHFDVSKIRNLKKTRLTAAVIEKAVKLLK